MATPAQTALSGTAQGNTATQQDTIAAAGTKVYPGLIGGRKASYRVNAISAVGGSEGETLTVSYTGPLGPKSFAVPLDVDARGLGSFVTNFGTDWSVKNDSVDPLIVTTVVDVSLSPGTV